MIMAAEIPMMPCSPTALDGAQDGSKSMVENVFLPLLEVP